MRRRIWILAAAVAVPLAFGGPANAAKLTVQYVIESGSADFPFSNSLAAVSGNLTVSIQGSGTQSAFVPGSGPATLMSFSASTGSFRIVLDPALGTGTSLGFVSIDPIGGYTATTAGTPFPLLQGVLGMLISGTTVNGTLTASTAYSGFGTLMFVGREIARTFVPEPHAPLLLGSVLLGLVGLLALRKRS